jgi:hypothetical protein
MNKRVVSYSLVTVLALALVLAVFAPGASARSKRFPPVIPLPDNFNGEGVATGDGPVIYAGSLANGAIYEADLRTGEGEILVEGAEGRISVGMSYDSRSGYLFVAGGPNGVARVYDTNTGDMLAEYPMPGGGQFGDFINDAIVTRSAVYFTNSFAPTLYRVPLGPGGSLPDPADVQPIPLGGEWMQVDGPFVFNANGIEAAQNGKYLLIVNSTTQTLYRVDPASGEATAVDLGGYALANGDGLVLNGRTLYVVQNRLNQIAEFKMKNKFLSGKLTDTITDDDFRVPTTAAKFGRYLYAVNARFGEDTTTDPTFEIVQVRR